MLLSRKGLPVSPSFVKIRKVEALPNAGEPRGASRCECRALCLVHLSRPICWAASEQVGGRLGILKECQVRAGFLKTEGN